MARQVISKEELLQKLNAELSRHREYYECRYEDVEMLAEPDESGCNWGHPVMVCRGTHPGMVKPDGFKVAKELRDRYNLA